jgi:hypothetical protein
MSSYQRADANVSTSMGVPRHGTPMPPHRIALSLPRRVGLVLAWGAVLTFGFACVWDVVTTCLDWFDGVGTALICIGIAVAGWHAAGAPALWPDALVRLEQRLSALQRRERTEHGADVTLAAVISPEAWRVWVLTHVAWRDRGLAALAAICTGVGVGTAASEALRANEDGAGIALAACGAVALLLPAAAFALQLSSGLSMPVWIAHAVVAVLCVAGAAVTASVIAANEAIAPAILLVMPSALLHAIVAWAQWTAGADDTGAVASDADWLALRPAEDGIEPHEETARRSAPSSPSGFSMARLDDDPAGRTGQQSRGGGPSDDDDGDLGSGSLRAWTLRA